MVKRAADPPDEGKMVTIRPANIVHTTTWIIGTTPLITHAWSEKAKNELLDKHLKKMTGGKGVRDPQKEFTDTLYEMAPGSGIFGFPVTGVKRAILTPAHKDRGVPRSSVLAALWLQHELVSVRPALAGAICDLPLVRIISGKPALREDMVRVGTGLNKTATLAYRGQFWPWAMRLVIKFNADVFTLDTLATLINEAGQSCGLGDWRNEKSGLFGAFRLPSEQETTAWEKFRTGKGKLPAPPVDDDFAEAA